MTAAAFRSVSIRVRLYSRGYFHQDWNSIGYPGSYHIDGEEDYEWADQFDCIMIADIVQEEDALPVCMGLMVKANIVAAITFYYPTAG